MDFRSAQFPSDALSVKRLRHVFPDLFDAPGMLIDGFGHFFTPAGPDKPAHLVRLNDLLSAERIIAAAAFGRASEQYPGEVIGDEEREVLDIARNELLEHYQFFRLADSRESAALLVRHVEEEGSRQARQAKGRAD